jgi:hypothetical protein
VALLKPRSEPRLHDRDIWPLDLHDRQIPVEFGEAILASAGRGPPRPLRHRPSASSSASAVHQCENAPA